MISSGVGAIRPTTSSGDSGTVFHFRATRVRSTVRVTPTEPVLDQPVQAAHRHRVPDVPAARRADADHRVDAAAQGRVPQRRRATHRPSAGDHPGVPEAAGGRDGGVDVKDLAVAQRAAAGRAAVAAEVERQHPGVRRQSGRHRPDGRLAPRTGETVGQHDGDLPALVRLLQVQRAQPFAVRGHQGHGRRVERKGLSSHVGYPALPRDEDDVAGRGIRARCDHSIGPPCLLAERSATVSTLLLLTGALQPSTEVLPALGLLSHSVRTAALDITALLNAPKVDAVLVDARRDLVGARSLCRLLCTTGLDVPLLAILTEGGLAGLTAEWGVDDVLLVTACLLYTSPEP